MKVTQTAAVFDLRYDEASNKMLGMVPFDRKSEAMINSIAYSSTVVQISEMAMKCLKEENDNRDEI